MRLPPCMDNCQHSGEMALFPPLLPQFFTATPSTVLSKKNYTAERRKNVPPLEKQTLAKGGRRYPLDI